MECLSSCFRCLGIRHRRRERLTRDSSLPPTPPSQPVSHDAIVSLTHSKSRDFAWELKEKACDIAVDPHLEQLPPEIRHTVLSLLPLRELNRLIRASPVYYQQFLLARKELLCVCLERTLRRSGVDACAVFRSSSVEFANGRSRDDVGEFLRGYQERRKDAYYSIFHETMTECEIISIARFHFAVILPLVRSYTAWTMFALADEGGSGHVNFRPLSRTEETRLLRGMYRYQLLCNLFGKGNHQTTSSPRLDHTTKDVLVLFFDLFEPWEIEEMGCIYIFAIEKYKQVFRDIRWDVHEDNPKFEGQRPPTPPGAFHLDNPWVHDNLLKGTASRGLELLHTAFYLIKDHPHLVTLMQQRMTSPPGGFLDLMSMNDTVTYAYRRDYPSARTIKEQQREPLPFLGDDEPLTAFDEKHPPLAWTLIWGGTYCNLHGSYYLGDKIGLWGYVFWDSERLERTGAKGILMRQWREKWGDDDPRDDIL